MSKYTQEGIHINTFSLLFESQTSATIDMQISQGLFEIDCFTYYKHNLLNNFIRTILINKILYPNIHRKNMIEYTYSSDDEHFDFILLGKYLKKILKNSPEIQKKLIYNYKNMGRASTCQYSIVVACYLENSKLIVGYMPLKDGRNILHRFVEIDYKNQLYIIDIAKNIIMKKDEYYKISKVKELGSISSSELKAIYNFALETGICNHSGIISMFGSEILNDLNNKKIIKKYNYQIPNFSTFIN